MDEAYASPDSDGHASLPSPSDSTFDLSQLPLKLRGRPQESTIVSSSFMHPPEDDSDDDDDSEDDETFGQNPLALEHPHRMLQTPPALSMRNRSNVLTPMNSKNEDNTPRATPRRLSQTTQKLQATSQAQGENIDPKQGQDNGRKPLPPKLAVQKPDYVSGNEEEAAAGESVSIPSDATAETVVEDDAVSADTREDFPKVQKWRNSPPKAPNPFGPLPLSASPQQNYPQLLGPDGKLRLAPGAPRLRHLNWLSSDSIDDADDESVEIPAGHSSRLKKAQAQRILDDTAFLGGDEASVFAGGMGMDNEMFDIFRREGSDGSFGEPELAAVSGEQIPTFPLGPILGGATHAALSSDAETIRESTDGTQSSQSIYVGTESSREGNIQHSVSFAEPEIQQTPSTDGQLEPVLTPFVQGPVGQSQAPDVAVATELCPGSITPTPLSIMSLTEAGPPAGIPKETTMSAPEPTGALNSTDKTARPASSSGLNSRPSFAPAPIIRPKTSPEYLQENSTAAALESSVQNVLRESPGDDIEGFTEINPQNSFHPEAFVAQSTPKDYYGGYNIWDIKKSGNGRRVSMNTPPSTLGRSLSGSEILNNPPEFSSLGSGFSFPSQPLRYQEWNPESVAREFTPPFPVEGVNGIKRMGLRLQGVDAPHNTPTPAVGKGSGPPMGWKQGKSMKDGKGRARSKSDPVENKVGGSVGKVLFTSSRVEKKRAESEEEEQEKGEEADAHPKKLGPGSRPRDIVLGIREKSVFSDERESPVGVDAAQGDKVYNDLDLGDDLDLSCAEGDEIGGRHWSGFTQDFQSSFTHASRDTSTTVDQGGLGYETSNLSLGNVDFRVHTPVSIGESKDVDDAGDRSNKTLWLRMAQAEAENDRFRKLLESNNIKIAGQDVGSSSSLAVIHESRDMSSSRNSDDNSSDDLGSLRRRVMELEALLQLFGRRDTELKDEIQRKDVLLKHWQTQYNSAQELIMHNQQRAMSLENDVKNLEQQAAVESINHDREINEVVSKLQGEKKHNRQKSVSLEDRVKFFEKRVHEAQEEHRRDVEDKERTISHLRHVLDNRRGQVELAQNGTGGNTEQDIIAKLEMKLFEQLQAHQAEVQATEDKYTNLLSEKEGLVRHLQAELDEMVNLMPVDHGSSRMIDEEEAEDWLDEKSREISQYYDDGLDQIITELHGTGEREDFEEAVEEAEMSLRRVADEAGLDEPLDKATLAAFGIRQLRTEYLVFKRLVIENEDRIKELIQANEELDRSGAEAQEKLGSAEDERDAFRAAAEDAETAGKILADQFDTLRAKLQEAEQHIHQLVTEHDALNQRCSETEEQVKSLEVDKVSLQRLVADTKRLNDMLKSQVAEADRRSQGFEEEIVGLRRQLAEEKDHISVIETETITFRHQLTEWEEAAMAVGKQRDVFQTQLKEATDRAQVISKEKEELSKKLLGAVKGHSDTKETDALKRQIKELQDRLQVLGEQHSATSIIIAGLEQKNAHTDQIAQRLAADKEFLKAELEVAASETKAARGRFAHLLHDTAEKELKWAGLKQEMERSITDGSGSSPGTIEAYRKSLAIIVQEIGKETTSVSDHDREELDIGTLEGIQDPELVKSVILALRWRDKVIAQGEERNKRYKGAAKKWMKENDKKKGRVEELVAEVRELGLRLKAEKKSSDEKMGQLILALRRGE